MSIRKIISCILPVMLVYGMLAAGEGEEVLASWYVHPVSFLASTASFTAVALFADYEKIYGEGKAWIVSPGFAIHPDGAFIGTAGGVRKYLDNSDSGYYLQAKLHAYLLTEGGFGSTGLAQIVFYWGHKKKFDRFNVFADAGLGYALLTGNTEGHYLGADLNLAIGFDL